LPVLEADFECRDRDADFPDKKNLMLFGRSKRLHYTFLPSSLSKADRCSSFRSNATAAGQHDVYGFERTSSRYAQSSVEHIHAAAFLSGMSLLKVQHSRHRRFGPGPTDSLAKCAVPAWAIAQSESTPA
jgi:hypothetical protein